MKLIVPFITSCNVRFSLQNYAATLLLLLCSLPVFAQNLMLTVTKTDETCLGNGSLAFAVANAQPGTPVNYKVYLLPNTTTAISDNSNTTVAGLDAGTYLVIASQTINGNTQTDSKEVVINDLVAPLQYSITSNNALCGADGKITVNVTAGNPVSYEIIAGPVIRTPQASNIFDLIPAGTYTVRVNDVCGAGLVVTHTLFTNGPLINISGPSFPDVELPSCNQVTISNSLSPGSMVPIAFPLTVKFTVYPPDGSAPLVYNQTITSSPDPAVKAQQIIPFFYGIDYFYDIQVTDPCGVVYNSTNNLINPLFNANGGFENADCAEKFISISLTKYVAPYQITFTSVPSGFNPADYNASHPGPFYTPKTSYGNTTNGVPEGDYYFSVTDACGRTDSGIITIENDEKDPTISVTPAGCATPFGAVQIEIPDIVIVSAVVEVAPSDYPQPLEHDVSAFLTADGLTLEDLPVGSYLIVLTDDCGIEYIAEFEVLAFNISSINPIVRPDCTPGKSTVSILSFNPPLTSLIITAAPPEFTETLPHDASYNISGGAFSMDNLPPGTYTFTGEDLCSSSLTATRTLAGYEVTENEFTKIPHCGSFDLDVRHESNGVSFLGLWMQMEITPGVWGHPGTGTIYPEGSIPTETNSVAVANNTLTPNYQYRGNFRILKYFLTFANGSSGSATKNCLEVLHEFEFYDDLTVLDVVSLTCSGTLADVEVNVDGALPLYYKIIEKNGSPFIIDNGTSNIFTGLESASYLVMVSDLCGHIEPRSFNVADLPSLVSANIPPDLKKCDDGGDMTEEFDLTAQNAAVIGTQDASIITITYHTSESDADQGLNAIPQPDAYNSGPATVYARLVYDNIPICFAVAPFNLVLYRTPQIIMPDQYTVCDGAPVTIMANAGFAEYAWSTNEDTRSITTSEAGSYTVTVTDINGCTASKTVQVVLSGLPVIRRVETTDWTDNNNTITVVMEAGSISGNFLYSLDGVNYQESNTFHGVAAGQHTVYVKDRYECGLADEEVYLLTYPKFFTPNGDGINETWRIKFSTEEPDMIVHIYDRFGKIVSSFDANSAGWDGTFNNHALPSTDYWFAVKRQNGEVLKGHFSLVR
ncbi:MAG: T9SS type B sorting domain-containing protein [Flavobacterium sp.]|nr:MAG: T9SS type B sorting domain-containing protein [Flavobacterium sp.]